MGEGAVLDLSRSQSCLLGEIEEDGTLDSIQKLVIGRRRRPGVIALRSAAGHTDHRHVQPGHVQQGRYEHRLTQPRKPFAAVQRSGWGRVTHDMTPEASTCGPHFTLT